MKNARLAAQICLLGVAAQAGAADIPSGWKNYADQSGKCLVSTPADWKPGKAGAGFVDSPDGKAQAFVDGSDLPLEIFRQAVLPGDAFEGAKVMKNTDSLYFAEIKNHKPGWRTLYVIMARGKNATCRTEIYFDARSEDTAKKIGESLRVK